jgi:hypothetical protein
MIALSHIKTPSTSLSIPKPKSRGYMPPPSKVFKDKRKNIRDKLYNQLLSQ